MLVRRLEQPVVLSAGVINAESRGLELQNVAGRLVFEVLAGASAPQLSNQASNLEIRPRQQATRPLSGIEPLIVAPSEVMLVDVVCR